MGERIEGKGLRGFLEDDASLIEKMTTDEFQEKKAIPNNSDYEVEKVYQTYCTLLEKM